MSDQSTKYIRVTTPRFRVAFPSVFEPKAFKPDEEGKYMLRCLFDKNTDISELKNAVNEAAKAEWGTRIPKGIRLPFCDGDETGLEGHEGTIYITPKSKTKPGVVYPDTSYIKDESHFYSGCYARATVAAKAYDQAGNRGVTFYLSNVQKLEDGAALAGTQTPAHKDFEAVDVADSISDLGAMLA